MGKDGRKGYLARELGKNSNKYNTVSTFSFLFILFVFLNLGLGWNNLVSFFLQIFFPILDDDHWSLFVVEPGKGLLTLLDSLYSEETATTIHSSLVRFFFSV